MPSRPGKVRLKTDPQQLRDAGLLLGPECAKGPLDLGALFGNSRPVEMEIGPGKGTFLMRRAEERPEINFLGVEWVGAYAAYVADRVARAGLPNVRLLNTDAEKLLAHLPDRSLWRVHIYFPDPWPKTRHHRRRLIKPAFLAQIHRVLRIGGWVGVVTDHEEYFQQVSRVFSHEKGIIQVAFPAPDQPDGGLVGTNFERKYLAGGRSFHALCAIRYR